MKKFLIVLNYLLAFAMCFGLVVQCNHSTQWATQLDARLLQKEAELLQTAPEGKKKEDFKARQRILNPMMAMTIKLFPVQYGAYCIGVLLVAGLNHYFIRGRRKSRGQRQVGDG